MLHLRPRIVAAALFGLFVAVSSAVASVAFEPASLSGAQNPRFGFAAGGNIQNLSRAELARYLDGTRAAHAGWIRIDVNWNVIQYAGPTSYDWTRFDNVVQAVASRGMRVLAGILYTPPWARPAGTSSRYPPSNPEDYASFVRAVVRRYAPMGVHAYEIWNEPNIANFWASGPDPARYAQLLRLAYPAAKSADPSATVVSAGLSPYGSYPQHDAEHMNPLRFLQQMYANDARGSFDALGWHPSNYPHDGLGFARWSAWSQLSQTSPSARSIMKAHGDGAKRIWLTEFSYPTGGMSSTVSEAAQARFVLDTYAALKRRRWAGPAFFYSYRDEGTNNRDIEQTFGVVHYDYSPKPSYRAYQRAAALDL
jgi:polysaccharide biosynthesis protein PslG